MNVKVEQLPRSQSMVTVEVEPERQAQAKEAAFRRIAREAVIPGFRKGRAPRNLVERYVSPQTVADDAETHLLEDTWNELRAGQFKDVHLFDTPQISVTQREPLIYQITLTHEPKLQLGDYKDIRIAPELVTVTDDDVNKMLEQLRDGQAQWQPVTGRPVQQGDMLTVQAHGMVGDQPIVVPEGYTVTVDEKTAWLAPGFVMNLVGMDVDVEKEFAVPPPADAPVDATTTALGTAYVTVKEIKSKVTPALDDALAKTLGSDDVAALTEKVRTSLLTQREAAARDHLENKILDAIAKVSSIEFPEVFVTQQVESMINDRGEYLRQRGIDLNLYLQITKTTLEGMRAELRPDAERRIRNYLLIEELERAEGIVVEDSAVDAEAERLIATQQDQAAARKELSTSQARENMHRNLSLKALFDRLAAVVTEGQKPVAPGAETPEGAEAAADGAGEPPSEPSKAKRKTKKPKLIIATH